MTYNEEMAADGEILSATEFMEKWGGPEYHEWKRKTTGLGERINELGMAGLVILEKKDPLRDIRSKGLIDEDEYKIAYSKIQKELDRNDRLKDKLQAELDKVYDDYEKKQDMEEQKFNEANQSNCFIATAAYGTPFAEEINILRTWRDTVLTNTYIGRSFIKYYYRFSPPIARNIEKSPTKKNIIRKVLNPIVKLLSED